MRLITCLFCSLILLSSLSAGELQPYLEEWVPPSFSLEDLNDETHKLNEYSGKVLLVNFWASWCGPCVIEMPALQRLHRKFSSNSFEILAINVAEPRYKVTKFVNLTKYQLKVLLDKKSETFRSWRARVLPTSYLLDRHGVPRYLAIGDIEWDSDQVVSIINKLIEQTEQSKKEGGAGSPPFLR